MDLLQMVLGAQSGAPVRQLAQNFGLGEDQAASAISALLPALAAGMNRNLGQQGGLESLLGALASGNHSTFLDEPDRLATPTALSTGNGILGHLLGSKDTSRQVASQAAASTGLSENVLKQMLPLVATMLMGTLSKQQQQPGVARLGGGDQAGGLGMLGSLLDSNRDGSVADDMLGIVQKLFSGR